MLPDLYSCYPLLHLHFNDEIAELVHPEALSRTNDCRGSRLLDDPDQKVQLAAYQMEKTPSGKITYNAAKGYHDDIIMATAFALHGLRSAQYTIL